MTITLNTTKTKVKLGSIKEKDYIQSNAKSLSYIWEGFFYCLLARQPASWASASFWKHASPDSGSISTWS